MLGKRFPDRRVFLRSDTETRFIRLSPLAQFTALTGSAVLVSWTIVATAILLMDSIGSGTVREQARREQAAYETRLNDLSQERDIRAEEAVAAQERFNIALREVSQMQSALLNSEERRRELETGVSVIQGTLSDMIAERDQAQQAVETLSASLEDVTGSARTEQGRAQDTENTLDFLTSALVETAIERDSIQRTSDAHEDEVQQLESEIRLSADRNDQIFRQLEDALSVSVEPLEGMFRAAGHNPETLIGQVRRGYSGQGGGPLSPISFSLPGIDTLPDPDTTRANAILREMDRINLYRIAAEQLPFANPVRNSFRFTSPFGMRSDPRGAGRRMHNGVDFAGPTGTPIYATADGVVTFAGWQSGYGRLVKIQHEFGVETRYAHNSRIRVQAGQRVSRGDRISDMGASGRVTGTHLHYEIRINGNPINPMNYIRAANDVF